MFTRRVTIDQYHLMWSSSLVYPVQRAAQHKYTWLVQKYPSPGPRNNRQGPSDDVVEHERTGPLMFQRDRADDRPAVKQADFQAARPAYRLGADLCGSAPTEPDRARECRMRGTKMRPGQDAVIKQSTRHVTVGTAAEDCLCPRHPRLCSSRPMSTDGAPGAPSHHRYPQRGAE